MQEQEFDLFGDPSRLPNGKRGRPAHRPSQKNRNKVIMLAALGKADEYIAAAIHCSVPTLKKYYFSELKHRTRHRARLESWQLETAFEKAQQGVVGAMRFFDQLVQRHDLLRMVKPFEGASDAPPKKERQRSKKEQARLDAEDAKAGMLDEDWGNDLNPGQYTQ